MFGPQSVQNLISSGNDTLDKFLGGGLLGSSVNLFERQGPSSKILDAILNKSIAATSLSKKYSILVVNFNTAVNVNSDDILSSLPATRQIRSEMLYKDIAGSSATAKIKIAWRYSQRGTSSPSDVAQKINQVDFGLSLKREMNQEDLGVLQVINFGSDDNLSTIAMKLDETITKLKSKNTKIIMIIKDLLHPFSPMIDMDLLKFIYTLRYISRNLDNGAIVISYDIDMFNEHEAIKEQIYNLVDSVITCHSYETGENKLTGYKDIDGTLNYVKVPKINSYGFHFQQNLSDWGYRVTKNHRFFVVDELSLPPCDDDDKNEAKCWPSSQTEMIKIENPSRTLERANPLEEFREVARDILPRKLD